MPMPMSAPISACDELDGRPARQVTRFQAMAAASAATIIASDTPPAGATSPPMVFATLVWSTWMATHSADQVEHCGDSDRQPGAERAGADGGRHRVGGVVEAVGEIEAKSHGDGDDEEDGLPVRHS